MCLEQTHYTSDSHQMIKPESNNGKLERNTQTMTKLTNHKLVGTKIQIPPEHLTF